MRPLWAPFPPFYKMVPFTIIPQGLNKAIQWFRQECFINCRAWDDIITVLLGRAATLLLGFVLSWTWGEGRSFWCFFHFLLGGGLKSSWLLLDSNLIGASTIHPFNTCYFGASNLPGVLHAGNTLMNAAYNQYGLFSLCCGPPGSKQPMPCCWNMTSQSTKDETTPAQKGWIAQCIT